MATDSTLVQIEPASPALPKFNIQTNFSPKIREHFPFSTVRPQQEASLNAIEQSYANDKKFTIIEAPTGTGKSGIAIAAGSWCKTKPCYGGDKQRPGAYILTPQKTLQQQYLNDFGNMGLVELKGKANYWCNTHNVDCDTGAILNNSNRQGDDREVCEFCPYSVAKKTMLNSYLGEMNFAYFLNETQYAGQLTIAKCWYATKRIILNSRF